MTVQPLLVFKRFGSFRPELFWLSCFFLCVFQLSSTSQLCLCFKTCGGVPASLMTFYPLGNGYLSSRAPIKRAL